MIQKPLKFTAGGFISLDYSLIQAVNVKKISTFVLKNIASYLIYR